MTACTLDDPRNARVLGLIHKWTFEDRILPSAADRASFDTQGGWGGPAFQLFKSGRYAMFASGRWALMLFRQFGAMPLAVVEPPHAGMPNTILSGGQSTVFRASPHLHAAKLFLAYMAGEDYNMQIVRDGDALPPNPKYTDTELFLRPPDHPNEWGCHEVYARAATEVAIVQSFSPFVLPVIVERFDQIAEDEVMNNRATPEEAGAKAAGRINEEIQRSLTESAMLRSKYEEWCARQEQIDRIKAEGRKIPAGLITNPFHLAWYRHRGMLDESDNAALSPAAQADRDE
jgi:multiple sugar transport system substrate-binding protein